ncbi:MAG: beta strand repeat-containing protein, partial [Pirellulaceae bacterium]
VVATDSGGETNGGVNAFSQMFTITVNAVNDAPTFNNISDQTVNEDAGVQTVAITGIAPGGGADEAGQIVTLTATSSDPSIVPNPTISGSGASQTLNYTPAANANGSVTITVVATDSGGETNGGVNAFSRTFDINVDPVNDLPTISDIPSQGTDEDTPTAPISFTVGDVETAPSLLDVTPSSNNQTLVPNTNIVVDGVGTNRTVTVTPAANQTGTTTITLTVADGDGETSSDTFVLTVGGVNDDPTISDIVNQSTDEDTPTVPIAFTVGDAETAAGDLGVTGSSSDTTLVSNSNIQITGNGANRTVTVTPSTNQTGSTTITVTVDDGQGGVTSDSFVLAVNAVNDAPTFNAVADQTVNEDAGAQTVSITGIAPGGGADEAGQTVTLSATSNNLGIIANPTISGSGASQTLNYTPVANANGSVVITVIATDDGGMTNGGDNAFSRTFTITVNAANDEPTFDPIVDQTVDASAGVQFLTISGVGPGGGSDEATQTVSLSASSNNPDIVPDPVITGSGALRTLIYTPVANASGSATITVVATDTGGLVNGGDNSSSRMFVITVVTTGGVLTGDMDLDRDTDFDDIAAFVLGLNNASAYTSQFGVAPSFNGDTDGDQDLDFDDIPGFILILRGGTLSGSVAATADPSVAVDPDQQSADVLTETAPNLAVRKDAASSEHKRRRAHRRFSQENLATQPTLTEAERAAVWGKKHDWRDHGSWI